MAKLSEGKAWYFIELFASLFMIVLLIVLFFGSVQYWTDNYPDKRDLNSQLFYIGVGIAVITIISQWIEGRVRNIIKRREEYKWLKKKKKRKKKTQ